MGSIVVARTQRKVERVLNRVDRGQVAVRIGMLVAEDIRVCRVGRCPPREACICCKGSFS